MSYKKQFFAESGQHQRNAVINYCCLFVVVVIATVWSVDTRQAPPTLEVEEKGKVLIGKKLNSLKESHQFSVVSSAPLSSAKGIPALLHQYLVPGIYHRTTAPATIFPLPSLLVSFGSKPKSL